MGLTMIGKATWMHVVPLMLASFVAICTAAPSGDTNVDQFKGGDEDVSALLQTAGGQHNDECHEIPATIRAWGLGNPIVQMKIPSKGGELVTGGYDANMCSQDELQKLFELYQQRQTLHVSINNWACLMHVHKIKCIRSADWSVCCGT